MRSEVMGKTLAMIMVIAMIATGIATLIPNVAAGDPQITGTVLSSVAPYSPISGVTVTYNTTTPGVTATATTDSQGKFTLIVYNGTKDDYTLTFEKEGSFKERSRFFLGSTYIGDVSATNTTLLEPLPTLSGTVLEHGAETPISNVIVNIFNSTTGDFIDSTTTGTDGTFSYRIDADYVDLYFKKKGYYSSFEYSIDVSEGADVGEVFLQKITPTPTIKVWGIVFEEGTSNQVTLNNALVSISEGGDNWITALSNEEGYYEMFAYPGNFQVMASKKGFYTTVETEWLAVPFDGTSVRNDVELEATPTPKNMTVSGTVRDDSAVALGGVDVYIHSADGRFVEQTVSAGDGSYSLNFYWTTSQFTLEAKKDDYFTNATISFPGTANTVKQIVLDEINPVHELRGYVSSNQENSDVISGATVTIYDKEHLYMDSTTTDENGYYVFNVHDGADFFVLVDADGYQSQVANAINITSDRFLGVDLYPSNIDVVKTTYTFVSWDRIEVTGASIIEVDNISARFNADRKYGMGVLGFNLNAGLGTLDAGEVAAWVQYLENKGVEKRNTKQFLTLDNIYYELDDSFYTVTIEGAVGAVATPAVIFINSTYAYEITDDLEDSDALTFELVLNTTYDTEYKDYSYDIILPLDPVMYEMTANETETNKVVVTGYNDPISVDPKIYDGETETVTMTIEASMNGTAKASIVSGVHYILNNSYDNYTVIVAQGGSGGFDTEVTFSAADSTDHIGDIERANFTWNFGNGTFDYGIDVKHNFTGVDGDQIVRLVITETGGNKTYRNITVKVDSQKPTAKISLVTTDDENVTFSTSELIVNEDFQLTFSGVAFEDTETGDDTTAGTASTDEIKDGDGGKGIIEKWYWSWGEEDSSNETITKEGLNNISHTYNMPGTFTLTMITTDVVGHESIPATIEVTVKDTTAPEGDFNIINEDDDVVTEVTENITYTYDATPTTDNFEELDNITFEWFITIGDNTYNYTGISINYSFGYVGEYNVTLKATDTAGNYENYTRVIHVNIGERPNVLMEVGSMVFDPETGTAGSAMTITVEITNDGKVNATGIVTTFYIRNSDDTDTEIGSVTTALLEDGESTNVTITWTPGKKGDFSIWANASCSGEHSSQWWDNKIDDFSVQTVTIKEAAWVMPAIFGGIIAVVVVVFFGMRYFMKSGTESESTGEKRKKR